MGAERFKATLLLGLMGPKMDISDAEAKNVVNEYRLLRANIVKYWDNCEEMIKNMMHENDGEYGVLKVVGKECKIYLPNGMYLEYPGLTDSSNGVVYLDYANAHRMNVLRLPPNMDKAKKIYGGSLTENIVQALARIAVGEQILKVSERYKIITMSHDEIVALVPEDEADVGTEYMLETMREPPAWAPDLPLNAEGGWAVEYSK